jgi:hypothetical protein
VSALALLLYLAGAAAAIVVGRALAAGLWRGIGRYRIHRAGPRRLLAEDHRIWRDPGPVDALDPVHGPGSPDTAPVPPFRFIEEHSSGSQPCLSISDGRGTRWRVKWGDEVRSEAFAVRFAWACGYFAEVTYFVPSGTIHGVKELARARRSVDAETGAFTDARFELEDPAVRKHFEEHSWAWDDNPFIGTPELSGLKIVVMLLSNWDTKDRRDVARGSNTAIFEHRLPRRRREARYLLTDWGGSMGRWGATIATRGRWDVAGFEEQTSQFVTGVADGRVAFGYTGQRTADVAAEIPVQHVQWFHGYAGRLTERYLVEALLASGATQDEAARFARALCERIRQLGAAVQGR